MLNPSIDELMKKINSKYTLVTVSSRRAREIQNDGNPLVARPTSKKFVGTALEEINEGKLYFLRENE
ncbi:DNA-directed RNA polymerase subunit omega [Bacillus solimangrovi]|uniref:DNA-directed RNA polymerase subunit omega n=1 Tax=Bacillus solimangrovi TaxID=1305675 RepID=A0A1E5LB34_9BACI|nr:DNA-directed RNA polymerase subunit omega [Bacillus solimangrovi]OEH91209.1 DNA-directed RNA polymerase subunit omega [Bacillus solimangrovi]